MQVDEARARYHKTWRRLRFWKPVTATTLPVVVGLLLFYRVLDDIVPRQALIAVAVITLVTGMVATYRLETTKCPKCGGRFMRYRRKRPDFRRCASCGLRFGTEPEPDPEGRED